MKKLFYSILLFFGLLVPEGIAQKNIQLNDAISEAILNNLSIRTAEFSEELAKQNADNQSWSKWPSVNLQLAPTNNVSKNNNPTNFIQGAINNLTLSSVADLNWVVYEGHKQKAIQEKLDQEVKIQRSSKNLKIEEKIEEVMASYFKALIAKEESSVFLEVLDRSRGRYESIVEQVNLGYQSNYNALRYENAMMRDSINYVRSNNDYANAIIDLNRAIGTRDFVRYEITENAGIRLHKFNENRMMQDLIRYSNQLAVSELRLEQKHTEGDEIRSALMPRVSFNTRWDKAYNSVKIEDIPAENGNNRNWSTGFQISYSLFNQRQVKNAMANNNLEKMKMAVELDELELELKNNVNRMVQEHNAKIDLLALQEVVLDNLKRNVLLEEDRYRNGLSSLLDYTSLQQEYTTASRTRLQAIYEILLLNAKVLRFTGGLRKYYDYGE